MKTYTPQNWYWYVAGDTTKVFSSASGDYVPVSDQTFIDWSADGTQPTAIDSEDSLGDVLAPYSIRPIHPVVLSGYQDSQAAKLTVEIVAKVLFNHENRIRTLENRTVITPQQFKAALKALL